MPSNSQITLAVGSAPVNYVLGDLLISLVTVLVCKMKSDVVARV